MQIQLEKLTNPVVRSAIEALQQGSSEAWFSQFAPNASLYDDGRKTDFKTFSSHAIGHEHFTSIDKVENNGLDIYGNFHSDQWGDFKTYFKFHINTQQKIERLDIGQANY